MSRAVLAATCVGLLLAVPAVGAPAASGGPLDVRPTAVGVAQREFRMTAYRRSVKVGRVKFNVKNYGEDVHDLVVLSPHGRAIGSTGEIRSGGQAVLLVRVSKPGTYRLICTQGDHEARGMKTRLVVRRPSPR